MWDFRTSCEEGQKRWLDVHENECKYARESVEEVGDETVTWDKEGYQETMGITLAMNLNIGDTELKDATFCSQGVTPVE